MFDRMNGAELPSDVIMAIQLVFHVLLTCIIQQTRGQCKTNRLLGWHDSALQVSYVGSE
jgi:hypothetical protein